jgi:hypothetical protein
VFGLTLQAAVRVEAHDRERLEELRRYITRLAPSDERVQRDAAMQLAPRSSSSRRPLV